MSGRRNLFQKKYLGKDYVAKGSDLILRTDEAWEKISRRARRAITDARKIPGLSIEKKEGTKAELDQFRTIWYEPDDPELGEAGFKENQHVYFAYLEGVLVAGIVVTEVEKNLFLHFNGGTEEAKELQIPSLMIWHIVEEFHDTDFKYLDIGCSFRPSLQRFFKNWATYEYPTVYHPPYLSPKIDITPFDVQSFGQDADPTVDVDAELTRIFQKPFTHFPRAVYAIYSILKDLEFSESDEVFITTTTGSPYISSCVTSTIEAVCTWNRELSLKTKVIFVIHEFGIVHPKLRELRALADEKGLILIEDCAYAWGSGEAGKYGDYSIYSFPKMFPVQYGGLLVGKHFEDEYIWKTFQCLDAGKRTITREQLSTCITSVPEIIAKRRENYETLDRLFAEEGYESLFVPSEDDVPMVYMLKVKSQERMKDLADRLEYYGIECGAFHHNNAIFLPIHQNLNRRHMEYIFGVVRAAHRIDGWVLTPQEYWEKINAAPKAESLHVGMSEQRWQKPA